MFKTLSHKACKITKEDDPLALWIVITPSGIKYGERTLYAAKKKAEEKS